MKTTTKTILAVFMLLAFSCKKENTAIQSSGSTDAIAMTEMLTGINDTAPKAVRIGKQVWMTRNLDVTRYRNGDRIPYVATPAKWASLTTGAWCWYKNDSANGRIYGKLYNWYAVNDPRGLAPEGWHVPSDAEWTTLTDYLGVRAGGRMKATGTIEAGTGLWYTPNTDATNSSGFTGLPGGFRSDWGSFYLIGFYGYWWSSTDDFANGAWPRYLSYNDGYIGRGTNFKQNGFSVRCLRD